MFVISIKIQHEEITSRLGLTQNLMKNCYQIDIFTKYKNLYNSLSNDM